MSSVLRARRTMAWIAAVGAGALVVACGNVHASGSLPTATATVSTVRPGTSPTSTASPAATPGGKANALLDLLDVLNFPSSACAAGSAHWLKVYPPNQFSAGYVGWTAQVCSGSKPVYMFVAPVRQGA